MADDYDFRLIKPTEKLPYYTSRKYAQNSPADAKSAVDTTPESPDYTNGDTIELRKVVTVSANANQMQGTAAAGADVIGNPVQVGGKDTAGDARPFLLATDGTQLIAGTAADGAAASGNPVQIGGKDGSGNIQAILTGADGATRIEFAGAATPTEIATNTTDVEGKPATANLKLLGYSVRESAVTPAAARAVIRHGTGNGDPAIAFINLVASEEKTHWFGDKGIAVASGIWLERVTGETHLVLYTAVIA